MRKIIRRYRVRTGFAIAEGRDVNPGDVVELDEREAARQIEIGRLTLLEGPPVAEIPAGHETDETDGDETDGDETDETDGDETDGDETPASARGARGKGKGKGKRTG